MPKPLKSLELALGIEPRTSLQHVVASEIGRDLSRSSVTQNQLCGPSFSIGMEFSEGTAAPRVAGEEICRPTCVGVIKQDRSKNNKTPNSLEGLVVRSGLTWMTKTTIGEAPSSLSRHRPRSSSGRSRCHSIRRSPPCLRPSSRLCTGRAPSSRRRPL